MRVETNMNTQPYSISYQLKVIFYKRWGENRERRGVGECGLSVQEKTEGEGSEGKVWWIKYCTDLNSHLRPLGDAGHANRCLQSQCWCLWVVVRCCRLTTSKRAPSSVRDPGDQGKYKLLASGLMQIDTLHLDTYMPRWKHAVCACVHTHPSHEEKTSEAG